MFSSSRRLSTPPSRASLSRRDLLVGGTALALGGALSSPARSLARQGLSPLKPDASATGVPMLRSLLEMIPADYIERVGSNGVHWEYADLDRQFASLGLHHESDGLDVENEPFHYGTYGLSLAGLVYRVALDEETVAAIGFQPFGMDQTLYVGAPGRQLTLFRGGFDPDQVIAAWTESGYEPYDTASGIPAWTIGLQGEFAGDHPIQSKVVSELNNVAIVEDVLISASYMELLEMALSFIVEGGASMADDPVFGPLERGLPGTTVSAIAVTSEQLLPDPVVVTEEHLEAFESTLAESDDRLGPMPPLTGLVAGVNEGATLVGFEWGPGGTTVEPHANAGTCSFRLGTGSDEDATRAATVAAGRWESLDSLVIKVPYLDLAEVASHGAEGPIAALDLVQIQSPQLWRELLVIGDTLPFAPS